MQAHNQYCTKRNRRIILSIALTVLLIAGQAINHECKALVETKNDTRVSTMPSDFPAAQTRADLTKFPDGRIVAAFSDLRDGPYSIYLKTFNTDGSSSQSVRLQQAYNWENQDFANITTLGPNTIAVAHPEFIDGVRVIKSHVLENFGEENQSAIINIVTGNSSDLPPRWEQPGLFAPDPGQTGVQRFGVGWMTANSADLYVQFLNVDNSFFGEPLRVNEAEDTVIPGSQQFFMDSGLNMFAIWLSDSRDGGDVMGCWFVPGASGYSALGGSMRLNQDEGTGIQYDPSAWMNSSGTVYASWLDARLPGSQDVYACKIPSLGTPDPERQLNIAGGPALFDGVILRTDADGLPFAVMQNGLDIWGQDLDADLNSIGGIQDLGLYEEGYILSAHDLFFDSGNHPGIVFSAQQGDDRKIYAAFRKNGGWDKKFIHVFEKEYKTGSAINIRAAYSLFDIGVATWTETGPFGSEVLGMPFNTDGTVGNLAGFGDGLNSAGQRRPNMAVSGSGYQLIVFEDYSSGPGSIAASLYSPAGDAVLENVVLQPGTEDIWYGNPSAAALANDRWIVGYEAGGQSIKKSVYSHIVDMALQSFQVTELNPGNEKEISRPWVASNDLGNTIFLWNQENADGKWDCLLQRFTPEGLPQGGAFIINSVSSENSYMRSSAAVRPNGDFDVAWTQKMAGVLQPIYACSFDKYVNAKGDAFRISPEPTGSNWCNYPTVASFADGFAVGYGYYEDVNQDAADSYFELVRDNGERQTIHIPGADELTSRIGQRVGCDGENYLLSWQQVRLPVKTLFKAANSNSDIENDADKGDIWGQRIAADGELIGEPFCVTQVTDRYQYVPDCVVKHGRIFNCWTDNRLGGTGYDIWMNVLDYDDPTQDVGEVVAMADYGFSLYPNYPNPFNAMTQIRFQVPVASDVEVAVYDLLGRRVSTLMARRLQPGWHTACWDSRDETGRLAATGVYLVRMQAGAFNQVRKILLIK